MGAQLSSAQDLDKAGATEGFAKLLPRSSGKLEPAGEGRT
jgi:hypothetical protein